MARVYAETLLRMAAQEEATETVTADLEGFVATLDAEPEFRRFLEAPQITGRDKQDVLDQAFGERLHPLVLRFLRLVVEKHREPLLPDIAAAWRARLDAQANRQAATVTTAIAADDATLDEIRRALEVGTGKTIALETRVDPSILGGLVIRTGDLLMDASVKSRIAALRHRLKSADGFSHPTPIGGTA